MKRFLIGSAAIGLAGMTAASGQTVRDEGVQEVALDAPGSGILVKANDPNVRRATAVVNGDIITGTDVDHRLGLILAANNDQLPAEEVERFRVQILSNLVDESLQMQEAASNKIDVSEKEVSEYFKNVAKQNWGSEDKAEKFLTSKNSSVNTLKRQIKAEISWNRLLSRNVTPFVNVSSEQAKEMLDKINASKGSTEYRLGEIFLSANDENRDKVYETARKILDQLQQGGSFTAYARQFSETSTAIQGGDLGWVSLSQVPQAIANAAAGMKTNEIVAVPMSSGIDLLLLIDKRQVAMADPRDSVLSLKQLAISFPAGTTEAQIQPLVSKFSEATQKIRGCGDADQIAQSLGAEVVNRDGMVVRELPGALQDVMLSLQVGQSTPAYGSLQDGMRVFVLCGRDAPPDVNSKSLTDIIDEETDKRVNARARLYLRDLRRDAIIEYN